MVTTLLRCEAVVLERTISAGANVLVEDGLIAEVGHHGTAADHVIDVAGTLLPGPVDLQVNGAGGRDVAEATPEALDTVAAHVLAGGAVAFLPTLITAPFDDLLAQLAAVATWIESAPKGGALPLGIHLEGPFLEMPGAHDAKCFVDPTAERIDALLAAARGHLRVVTLAPSRSGAAAAIAKLKEHGITVAFGHCSSVEGFTSCVSAGASLVTHLFNAMGEGSHRQPGFAGLALDEARLSCSLILDGEHVHPVVVRNAWRCLGVERTILVTDCVAAAGMPEGEYRLAGMPVWLKAGLVRDARGVLAGSALTMAQAAANWLRFVPSSGPWSLARVAATNPARLIGAAKWGSIAPGRQAAFACLGADGALRALLPQ